MLVTHIIPTAFNYFDDIKQNAFKIAEELPKYGIDCKVLTLQYDQPTKKQKESVSGQGGSAPSYNFSGNIDLQTGISDLINSDLIHLHCPLMGGASDILKCFTAFKKRKIKNAKLPLVCTYYRPIETPDVFSLILLVYNAYYLPKLFQQADVIGVFSQTFKPNKFNKINLNKFVDLNVENKEEISINCPLTNNADKLKYNNQLKASFSLSKLLAIYEIVLSNKTNI